MMRNIIRNWLNVTDLSETVNRVANFQWDTHKKVKSLEREIYKLQMKIKALEKDDA